MNTATLILFACGGGNGESGNSDSGESSVDTMALLQGTWHVDSLESERYSLEDCERGMSFNFTSDAEGEVSGIKTMVLDVKQGEESPCDFPGPNDNYTTAYALANGGLYVKNFQLMGKQFSGMFKINSISDSELSITSMKHTFYLKK